MVRFHRCLLFGVLILVSALAASGQERIGTIETLLGNVEIDAFATGVFVDARNGDVLYETSVVRTDYDSWADIIVGGRPATVPPLTEVRVATYVRSRADASGRGFFGRLFDGVRAFLAAGQETQEEFAGRAGQQSADEPFWMLDPDADGLYHDAVAANQAGEYRAAVDLLRSIEDPMLGTTYTLEEYYVELAFALAETGNHDAAVRAAFEYLGQEPSVPLVPRLPRRLQLLCAMSAFVIADDELAVAAVDTYLGGSTLDVASPQAVMIKVYYLRLSGHRPEAEALLQDAMAANPSVDWAALGAL